jgi:ABC-type proline/glycine betaine transport system substrate-binding protein
MNEKVRNDYDYSRDTYYELLEKGKQSLDLMIEVARESEHPRAFEVLSNMVKNLADVNDKLMDLNIKNKDISKEDKEEVKQITNNNVFLGSTADLQRLLQDEEKIIDAEPNTELPR